MSKNRHDKPRCRRCAKAAGGVCGACQSRFNIDSIRRIVAEAAARSSSPGAKVKVR